MHGTSLQQNDLFCYVTRFHARMELQSMDKSKQLAFINVFRALAAFWVLTGHCQIWGGWKGIPLPGPKFAVDLFMMISGYLMAENAIRRETIEPLDRLSNWGCFWIRRFFRLAPTYYMVFFVTTIFGSQLAAGILELQALNPSQWQPGGKYDPSGLQVDSLNIFLHVTFLFGLLRKYSMSSLLPDWSLSLEMQFYFVFPLIFVLARKYGYLQVLTVIAGAVLIIGYQVAETPFPEPSFLPLKLNYFIAGMLLCLCLDRGRSRSLRTGCAILGLCLTIFHVSAQRLYVFQTLLWSAMYILGSIEFERPTMLGMLFRSTVIKHGADWSYGVYLVHGIFIQLCGLMMSRSHWLAGFSIEVRTVGMFLFTAACSYATASQIHKYLEKPMISWGGTLLRRISNRDAA